MPRPLTYAEVARFIQDHAAVARWQLVFEFATEVFGSRARRVVLEAEGMGEAYDTGLPIITAISGITAYDASGEALAPDPGASLFRRYGEQYPDSVIAGTGYLGDVDMRGALVDACYELGNRLLHEGIALQTCPFLDYDLSAPPPLTVGNLYVNDVNPE